MRAILIDPAARSVTEVETTAALDDLYRLLDCSIVERIRLGPRHNLWVDEEGGFKSRPRFQMRSAGLAPLTIVGRGLLLDQRGAGSVSCSLPLELVRQMIAFERVALSLEHDDDGEPICSNPGGHEFECTGTQYGGDDERWGGEGRSLCIHCGADGDA